jgi:transcriptional regulator with XRE-family HTH domain
MDMLGKFIQEEIKKRNWSQADLSRAADMKESAVSNLVSGQRKLGITSLIILSKAFKVSVDKILRAAGLLPPIQTETEQSERLLFLFDQLGEDDKATILQMMEFLLSK